MKTITSRRIAKRNKIRVMQKIEKEAKKNKITFHQPLHYQLEKYQKQQQLE